MKPAPEAISSPPVSSKDSVPVEDRIRFGEKVGYALGDSASNLYWKTFEFFLVIYYTDVFGISAAAAGTMLLVTRVLDAVADPVMGALADRTNTRWGHFRPYLLWFAVPLAIFGVLTFTTPDMTSSGKLVYAYATYGVLMILYTVVNIPYSALMGVMTPNSMERTALSTMRFIGAFVAAVFVQYFTLGFVKTFGGGNEARGWQLTMVLYGVLAVILFVICFATTRERVAPPAQQSRDLKGDLKTLLKNRPWLILTGMLLLLLAALVMKGSASAYYFKYFVQREDLLGAFLVANGLAALAGIAIAQHLARWFGKKRVFIASIGGGGLLIGLFYLAGPTDIWLIFALQILSSFVIGPNSPLLFAMFADTADHAEWKTGRRNTGLVFASAIFSTKVGVAIGAWLVGLLFQAVGYVANVPQTERSLGGIVLAMSLLPAVLMIVAAALMKWYELTDPMMVTIERDLKARKEAARA